MKKFMMKKLSEPVNNAINNHRSKVMIFRVDDEDNQYMLMKMMLEMIMRMIIRKIIMRMVKLLMMLLMMVVMLMMMIISSQI